MIILVHSTVYFYYFLFWRYLTLIWVGFLGIRFKVGGKITPTPV